MSSPTPNNARRLTPIAVMAAVLVAGCTPPDTFAPACPQLRLLKDGADLSSFSARGQDVTDLQVWARMTAVPASCSAGGRNKVNATMHVEMVVIRGPALPGRSAQVPYFVTVLDGEKVLQQKDYTLPVEFPVNVDRVPVVGSDIEMQFPVSAEKSAAAYTVYVSFRLTPQQLQYNRSHPGAI